MFVFNISCLCFIYSWPNLSVTLLKHRGKGGQKKLCNEQLSFDLQCFTSVLTTLNECRFYEILFQRDVLHFMLLCSRSFMLRQMYVNNRIQCTVPFASERSEEHTSELQSHLNLVCRL